MKKYRRYYYIYRLFTYYSCMNQEKGISEIKMRISLYKLPKVGEIKSPDAMIMIMIKLPKTRNFLTENKVSLVLSIR